MMVGKGKLALILLGAPGSGKGTQGEFLERKGFKRYVMSEFLKEEIKRGSQEYEFVFRKGILLPEERIFSIFQKYFKGEKKVVIDGIPRSVDQAYWLFGFLKSLGYDFKVVYLKTNEKKLVRRITSRFYCSECHRMYNALTMKPRKRGVCDDDGGKLVQREDDKPKVFRKRLKIFDDVRSVMLDVFKGCIVRVDGDRSIPEVSLEIGRKLGLK